MRAILFLAILFYSGANSLFAQTLGGKVFGQAEKDKEILPGAVVRWLNTTISATTNENGVFQLSTAGVADRRLVISFVGYIQDTLMVGDKTYISITLKPTEKSLGGVTVTGSSDTKLSRIEGAKMEVISQKEISKSACCDMAGCFETQATVQSQTTNVITNSKELRILGLSGVYNQLLIDGMPLIQGLTYTYGITGYPGTLIDNIFVAKGANSVLQGFESISGQINLIPKQPDKTEQFFANVYMNSFWEKHINLNYATTVGKKKKWSSLLAFHSVHPSGKFDRDNDNFLDLPLLTRYMVFNKWKYGNENKKGLYTNIGLRFLTEQRIGGQTNFDPESQKGSTAVYGQTVNFNQYELYAKTGYRFNSVSNLVLAVSSGMHKQHSYFGTLKYDGEQQSTYGNLQHEYLWKGKHQLKYGASFRYHKQTETIGFTDSSSARGYAGVYTTNLQVPGLFAENTFKWHDEKLTLIAGGRLDRHQTFGTIFTPRALLKYVHQKRHTIRLSSGSGWRQVFLFAENNNLLASSRDIVFQETLRPEQAVNWGMNYTYTLTQKKVIGTFSADFYQTRFSNQFFPDYDSDPTKAYIRNFAGKSISNAFQVDANLIFSNGFEMKFGYNYLDVFRIVNSFKFLLPFNPKHRAMAAFSYRPKQSKWYVDANLHWYDKQRLPSTLSNPIEYRNPDYSKPYSLASVQVTYKAKRMEVYAGCENIAGFRQRKPIVGWQDPFGKYFDTSSVWGPTRGREIYAGLRWKVK